MTVLLILLGELVVAVRMNDALIDLERLALREKKRMSTKKRKEEATRKRGKKRGEECFIFHTLSSSFSSSLSLLLKVLYIFGPGWLACNRSTWEKRGPQCSEDRRCCPRAR